MTLKQYQTLCVKSEPKYLTRGDEALLGLMSLNAASGKALEMYKKTLFEGSQLDKEVFIETLGWVICNVATIAHAFDVELADVLKKNANMLESTENSDAGDGEKE